MAILPRRHVDGSAKEFEPRALPKDPQAARPDLDPFQAVVAVPVGRGHVVVQRLEAGGDPGARDRLAGRPGDPPSENRPRL